MTEFIIALTLMVYYYNIFLTFFVWKKPTIPNSYYRKKEETFCILIACHNEEEVIEGNLNAIFNSSYSKEKYKVYVIADNCSDNTINNVNKFVNQYKNFNCEIIEVKGGSKPKALNKAISYLKSNNKWIYDNILILDADNKISPGLLESFNYYHQFNKILQCKIKSDNDETFIAKGFTASFNNMSHRFQMARNKVGLSASLSGTGFSINRKVFDEVGFHNCHTLTEDLEFSILSIIKGYSIIYINEQYVLNQNVDDLRSSITQRIRWCRGHAQVSIKLTGKLIKEFLKKPRWQLIDSFLFINTPSCTILSTIVCMYLMFNNVQIGLILKLITILILIYNIVLILKFNNWKLKYLLPQIHFTFCVYFIIIIGVLTFNKTHWAKTKHKKIS